MNAETTIGDLDDVCNDLRSVKPMPMQLVVGKDARDAYILMCKRKKIPADVYASSIVDNGNGSFTLTTSPA